jgi:putative RecB family exonuclease
VTVFFASPSMLKVWRRCRLAYRFKYVDRVPAIPRPWLSFGSSVHAALREIFNAGPAKRTVDLFEHYLDTNWDRRGYVNDEEEARYRERALTTIRRYAKDEEDFTTAPRPRLLEFNVEQKIDDVVLRGRVDRVDDTDEGLVVIDYKTGRPPPAEQARGDEAFTMYAMLVHARFKQAPKQLEWRFVETGDRVVTAREPAAFGRVRDNVLAEVAAIRAEVSFEPSPGAWCRFCDYLDRCPEGRAAAGDDGAQPDQED